MIVRMEPRAPLPSELRMKLDGSLLPGERLLWSAQPDPKKSPRGLAIWLFAIPWTAFALFWESQVLRPWFAGGGRHDVFDFTFGVVMPLFGLPFVLIGFAMMALPFLSRFRIGYVVHALTDRRLLTMRGFRQRTSVKSVFVDRIGPIERKTRSDGWGSISIQTGSRIDSDGDRIIERFTMSGIPDVATVEKMILERQPA